MAYKDSEKRKEWYQRNREAQDARAKDWRRRERLRLIEEFGGACSHCPERDPVVLDFDHIYDDGFEDKKKSKKSIIFYVKENPSRFQLLCKNCNWRKEYWRRTGRFKFSDSQLEVLDAQQNC